MTMTPELRNWYLSNLGIVQYVPKGEDSVALPFHSPATEIFDSSTSQDVEATNTSPPKAERTKSQAASVLELVGEKTDAQPDTEQEASVIEHNKTATEGISDSEEGLNVPPNNSNDNSPVLNFRLACWHPCEDMLVINQLEPNGHPDQNQSQLLSNILKAIGRLPNGLPKPELLDWPMDNSVGEGADHTESGAKAMLSVFLDARIRKYGVLWVLLMGELSSELLFPGEKSYVDLLGRTEEIPGGAQIMVVRSLQTMLEEPHTKAETWQTIRCLAEQS